MLQRAPVGQLCSIMFFQVWFILLEIFWFKKTILYQADLEKIAHSYNSE